MECKLPECIKKHKDWVQKHPVLTKPKETKDSETVEDDDNKLSHCSVEGCHKLFHSGIGCKCSDCDKWFCMKHEMKFLLTIIDGRVDEPLCFQCSIAEDDARHGRNTHCDGCERLRENCPGCNDDHECEGCGPEDEDKDECEACGPEDEDEDENVKNKRQKK
jgi:hypothetical protein